MFGLLCVHQKRGDFSPSVGNDPSTEEQPQHGTVQVIRRRCPVEEGSPHDNFTKLKNSQFGILIGGCRID